METYNYSQFKFNEKNRVISNKNVMDIKNSISEIGFIKQRSVIINKDYVIMDGHHRFIALKELQMPIIYEIEEEMNQREMILLNSCQKNWKLEDFIELYAKDNIPVYQEIINVSKQYNITITNSIIICIKEQKNRPKLIRSGYSFEIYNQKEKLIDLIIYAKEQLGFTIKKDFIFALRTLLEKSNENQINKVKNSFSSIREQVSVTNYLITFENIINKNLSKENRINLLNK